MVNIDLSIVERVKYRLINLYFYIPIPPNNYYELSEMSKHIILLLSID